MRVARWTLAIGLAGVVTLAGCAKIRYPNYYVLNVPEPPSLVSAGAPALGSVAVRQFSAPGILREGPIVYREAPDRVGFYEYERWAQDPRRDVTSAMIRAIQSRGSFQEVDLYDGTGTRDCLLTGTIDHMEEVDDRAGVWVEVALSARLSSLHTGNLLWQGRSTKKVKVDDRSVTAVVAEMSHEMGSAIEDLVSSMSDTLAAADQTHSLADSGH
jgi:ABC-type uncharacterized transport system auxiliary subunit